MQKTKLINLNRLFATLGSFGLITGLFFTFQNFDLTSAQSICTSTLTPEQKGLKLSLGQVFQGFGCQTVGGLNGTVCTVTSDQDPKTVTTGTLRYCVEKRFGTDADAKVIVKFDPKLAGAKIRLSRVLTVGSNTTIDGRVPQGSTPITITNAQAADKNPCYPDATKSTNLLCKPNGNPVLWGDGMTKPPEFVWRTNLGAPGELIRIRKTHVENNVTVQDPIENVIISDLVFTPEAPAKLPNSLSDTVGLSAVANPCALTSSPVTGGNAYTPRWVKGCPVMINIGGNDPVSPARTTKVVIANNEFHHCAEKCLHGNGGSDLVTIVRNHFHDSYFASLILMSANYDVTTDTETDTSTSAQYTQVAPVRYTFYHNHFERVFRRSPRCALYVWCHLYGNVVENWGPSKLGGFGMSADTGSKIVGEWNFLAPIDWDFAAPPATYTDNNPAISNVSSHYDASGNLKDKPSFYMGRWALADKQGIVGTPMSGDLRVAPIPLIDTKPFIPADYYYYSTGALQQATYDSIIANAGPRH